MHLITKREGAFHPDRGGAFSYQSKIRYVCFVHAAYPYVGGGESPATGTLGQRA